MQFLWRVSINSGGYYSTPIHSEAVEMPSICLDEEKSYVCFSDGRHRFAWLRDHGE
jgi:hypothetical protein